MRKWFDAQREDVLALAIAEVPESFPPLADYDDPMSRAMTPILAGYWQESGAHVTASLEARTGLDMAAWEVSSPYLRGKIEQSALAFCRATNEKTSLDLDAALAALRAELAEGLVEQGDSLAELTKRVKGVFNDAETWRAQRIAATEASRAVHAAQMEAAIQSNVVAGLEWLLADDACPLCHRVATEAKRVRLGAPFAIVGDHPDYSVVRHPPLHPNDQCTVVEVLKPEYGGPEDPGWADSPAQPTPEEIASAWPSDPQALEVVRGLGGSTGAELVRDPRSDALYVRKRGSSPDHLREEAYADAAYRGLGVPVPETRLYETAVGPVKLARYIEGKPLAELKGKARAEAIARVREHFAADALLGNWDVIGLGEDNILVDAAGTPYRIDNGGALRYRAMGAKKNDDQWTNYPTELWTLRDTTVNPQSAGVFGDLKASELARQIRALEERPLDLPAGLKETVAARRGQMRDAARAIETFVGDKFKDDYADGIAKHLIGIRKAGISDVLPTELKRKRGEGVEVYDEHGKKWDHLRGRGSAINKLYDYIDRAGGNRKTVEFWKTYQAGDSWSDQAQAMKAFLAGQRGVAESSYYWKHSPAKCRKQLATYEGLAGGAEKYAESVRAMHAFTYEYLNQVNFDGKRSDGTVRLIRTEDLDVMQQYGLKPGDQDVKLKRGVAESTSLYEPYSYKGYEVTTQKVPLHRVLATYWQSRHADTESGAFAGDHENEFVAILDDIPLTYHRGRRPEPE